MEFNNAMGMNFGHGNLPAQIINYTNQTYVNVVNNITTAASGSDLTNTHYTNANINYANSYYEWPSVNYDMQSHTAYSNSLYLQQPLKHESQPSALTTCTEDSFDDISVRDLIKSIHKQYQEQLNPVVLITNLKRKDFSSVLAGSSNYYNNLNEILEYFKLYASSLAKFLDGIDGKN
jgi:hypothetical protein